MKRSVLIVIFLVVFSVIGLSQDIITKYDSAKIEAKIIEVNLNTVKYKKYSNQDGHVYVINKSDIHDILYKNGDRDIFTKEDNSVSSALDFKENKELLNTLAAKGNRVYIDTINKNAAIHAKRKLKNLGYWKITDNKKLADFILSFDTEYNRDSANGYAEFIHPETNEIFFKTEREFADITTDMNLKRGIIYKLINSDIIPLMIK
ncbi:MAG: hypothetical protein L3J56_11930 [Bacteroidales bacterium]|nr:hypothetical protein [Bacteroidales bacterium]